MNTLQPGSLGGCPFCRGLVLCGRRCELLPFSCGANYKRELLALRSLPFHRRDVLTSEMSLELAQPREQSALRTMSLLPSVADSIRCFICFAAVERGAVSPGVSRGSGADGRALPALYGCAQPARGGCSAAPEAPG